MTSPQLSGRAQLAFLALPIMDSANYDAIKGAIDPDALWFE